jgi:predicted deacylase
MESTELKHQIRVLQAHIIELGELVVDLHTDPILRAKTISRLIEQNNRLTHLSSIASD